MNWVICAGVSIVAVIPDVRYYIWRELYRVYTCHVSVGLVEIGLLILPNRICKLVNYGTFEGKHPAYSCRYNGDKFVNVHADITVDPIVNELNVTVDVEYDVNGILILTIDCDGNALAICTVSV